MTVALSEQELDLSRNGREAIMAKKAKKAKSKTKKGKMGKKSAPARKKKGVVAKKSDKLYETVKREIGKFNIGLYCTSCSEFFALAVVDDARKGELIPIKSVGTPLFECPFCHHQQRRQVSEIARLHLTQGNLIKVD